VARIEETRLPGIGLRHDFTTTEGTRIGMVTYREGRRELVIFDERDPDECRATLPLSEDDARTLADLLGGSQVIDHLDRLEPK
jgi:TrkA domain protein